MKKVICFMLACLLIFSLVSITAFAVSLEVSDNPSIMLLRAGGGGGGSSGGGSLLTYIIAIPLALIVSVVSGIRLTKRSRKAKELMAQMAKSDNAWKFENISDDVNNAFYAIQNAWSNMDMAPASRYMSRDLYYEFQTQLKEMADRNERNVLEDIKLEKALPVAVYDDFDNSRDFVWFYISGSMIDYTINTNTRIIVGNKEKTSYFVEYWQFVRDGDSWVLNKILQEEDKKQIPFNK